MGLEPFWRDRPRPPGDERPCGQEYEEAKREKGTMCDDEFFVVTPRTCDVRGGLE